MIPEPPSNQIQLAYLYLTEPIYFCNFVMADHVQTLEDQLTVNQPSKLKLPQVTSSPRITRFPLTQIFAYLRAKVGEFRVS